MPRAMRHGMQTMTWNLVTQIFGAWIIFDMMLSSEHDTVARKGLYDRYDFIISESSFFARSKFCLPKCRWAKTIRRKLNSAKLKKKDLFLISTWCICTL